MASVGNQQRSGAGDQGGSSGMASQGPGGDAQGAWRGGEHDAAAAAAARPAADSRAADSGDEGDGASSDGGDSLSSGGAQGLDISRMAEGQLRQALEAVLDEVRDTGIRLPESARACVGVAHLACTASDTRVLLQINEVEAKNELLKSAVEDSHRFVSTTLDDMAADMANTGDADETLTDCTVRLIRHYTNTSHGVSHARVQGCAG